MSTLLEWQESIQALGERLKIARRRRRWSRQDMADRMGVSRQTIERLEAGAEGVRLGTLAGALRVLSLSPDVLDAIADPRRDAVALSLEIARAPGGPRRSRADDADFTL